MDPDPTNACLTMGSRQSILIHRVSLPTLPFPDTENPSNLQYSQERGCNCLVFNFFSLTFASSFSQIPDDTFLPFSINHAKSFLINAPITNVSNNLSNYFSLSAQHVSDIRYKFARVSQLIEIVQSNQKEEHDQHWRICLQS